jgi:hypothetical protein
MSARKQQKLRGPSRPIDPRRAPGVPRRKGPDMLGFWLVGIATAFVLVIFLVTSTAQPQSTAVTTPVTDPNAIINAPSPPVDLTAASAAPTSPAAAATQQMVAFATRTADLPRVTAAEAKTQVDARIIDVRQKEIYAAEHIKGSTNIPYTDVQARLAEFPKAGNLIVYCQ